MTGPTGIPGAASNTGATGPTGAFGGSVACGGGVIGFSNIDFNPVGDNTTVNLQAGNYCITEKTDQAGATCWDFSGVFDVLVGSDNLFTNGCLEVTADMNIGLGAFTLSNAFGVVGGGARGLQDAPNNCATINGCVDGFNGTNVSISFIITFNPNISGGSSPSTIRACFSGCATAVAP